MPFHVCRHTTAREFLDRAEDWLLRREAEHNVMLGLAARLLTPSDAYAEPIYYATIEAGPDVVGCALRTPPFKLHVTTIPPDSVPLLVDDLAQVYEEIPAVLARAETALAVGKAWCARRGGSAAPAKHQRIYQLERVLPSRVQADGALRMATMHDLDLVTEWVNAFNTELRMQADASRRFAHQRIQDGSIALWEAGAIPVSMAVVTGETRNGARIGYVYTPVHLRRNGFASACVAALSQHVLDGGKRLCFLFTDLANPTSNAIYQQIGYVQVCDVVDCAIELQSL